MEELKPFTITEGDIVLFDGEENRLGIIEWVTHETMPDIDVVLGKKPDTSCKIRELSGRVRVRSLWHDIERGLIRKLDSFDAGYIYHLFK